MFCCGGGDGDGTSGGGGGGGEGGLNHCSNSETGMNNSQIQQTQECLQAATAKINVKYIELPCSMEKWGEPGIFSHVSI